MWKRPTAASMSGKDNSGTTVRIAFLIFLALLIGNGLYKYLIKGVIGDYSQWDLYSHTSAFSLLMQGFPLYTETSSLPYLPPFMPLTFPLLDFFASFSRGVTQWIWLIATGSSYLFIFSNVITTISQKNESRLSWREQFGLVLIFWLFPGTYLGFAAGQISMIVIICLMFFWMNESKRPFLAAFFLALSTMKLTLAAPFFIYLLFRNRVRTLIIAILIAISLNILASFFYLGFSGHVDQMWQSAAALEPLGVNSYLHMGASGRVDLAPFLAIFSIQGFIWIIVAVLIFTAGLFYLYRQRNMMPDALLLLDLNLIFFIVLYHRAYDLTLLLLLALPLIWKMRCHLGNSFWAALIFTVLPLQLIFQFGMANFPELSILWHLIGASTIVAIISTGIFLNKTHSPLSTKLPA